MGRWTWRTEAERPAARTEVRAAAPVEDRFELQRTLGNRAIQRGMATLAELAHALDGPAAAAAVVQRAAARGTRGVPRQLPHLEKIQAAFGGHDVSRVEAFTDAAAQAGAADMGARAFASGERVGFAGQPDLFVAAHEAAHVVQQRAGVQLGHGVGAAGDRHEHHADEVARRVVQGRSAEGLLDRHAGRPRPRPAATPVQCFLASRAARQTFHAGSRADKEAYIEAKLIAYSRLSTARQRAKMQAMRTRVQALGDNTVDLYNATVRRVSGANHAVYEMIFVASNTAFSAAQQSGETHREQATRAPLSAASRQRMAANRQRERELRLAEREQAAEARAEREEQRAALARRLAGKTDAQTEADD